MDVALIHKALANPVRREILSWLKSPAEHFSEQEHPLNFGVCAGQIDKRSGLSQSTMSAHLAVLQSADLVCVRKVGQWNFYSRNEATIQAFLTYVNGEL